MAKKNTPNPAEETPVPETAAEETKETAPETFTVTREQMEKMEGLAAALAAEQDKYLRLAAEYDNYRKRTAKEKEHIYTDAKADTVTALLGVYDNLTRGIAQYGEEES
ncbi:MAG: nucleotide exchange factor GrpE, partial [Oscillospiraceae bacterium]|nr:nucleotide exchange factor GrpE [Oscillospiraceae bacterium]